jgi:hypothetical protein
MENYKNTPVLLIGDTGTGKSYTVRTLPPDKTLVINTEDKTLSDSTAHEFTNKYITTVNLFIATLDALIASGDPEHAAHGKYDYVVIDSLTAMAEIVENYCNKQFTNYEQWKQYNSFMWTIMHKIKKLPQKVFVLGIPEQKDMSFGEKKAYFKVQGNVLKYGGIEKEFTIVLFTNPIYAEEDDFENDIEEGDMVDCYLKYKPNKKSTAKSPPGMFSGKLPNDGLKVLGAIDEFYGSN